MSSAFRWFKWIIVLVMVTFLVVFVASLYTKRASVQASLPIRTTERLAEWVNVDDGLERYEAVYTEPATGTKIILYRIDPSVYEFRFADEHTKRTLDYWRRTYDAVIAVNGVYFDEQDGPQGFLRIDQKNISERRYDLDKSGLIVLDHPPRLLDTKHTDADALERFAFAGQSYPFFLRQGKEAIEKDSGLIARRTFFGIDEGGLVYVGVVPDAPITLFQLMHLLKSLPVRWQAVINLDGGPSTGLASQTREKREVIESYTGVPNVLLVTKKR